MTGELRAIETQYRGHRFRSRLEARYAVFLDALGVAWEYEPEGFELPGGGRYLPDFFLPKQSTYLEVKPSADLAQTPDGKRVAEFAKSQPHPILVACGQPLASGSCVMTHSVLVYDVAEVGDEPDAEESRYEMDHWSRGKWIQCPVCGSVGSSGSPTQCACLGVNGAVGNGGQWRVLEALRLAAQARFEFGEQGGGRIAAQPAPAKAVPIYLAGKFPACAGDVECPGCDELVDRHRCPLGRMCPRWHWRAEMWGQPESGKDTAFYHNAEYNGFLYAGPDLGVNSNHGLWSHDTPERCFAEITECVTGGGALFAWIHREDVFGTLIELGFARAHGLPIYAAFDSSHPQALSDQMWFVRGVALGWCSVPSPRLAWARFLDWWACRTAWSSAGPSR